MPDEFTRVLWSWDRLAGSPPGCQQTAEPETPERSGVATAKVGQVDDVDGLRLETVPGLSTQQGSGSNLGVLVCL
jgi:hypothetical protein